MFKHHFWLSIIYIYIYSIIGLPYLGLEARGLAFFEMILFLNFVFEIRKFLSTVEFIWSVFSSEKNSLQCQADTRAWEKKRAKNSIFPLLEGVQKQIRVNNYLCALDWFIFTIKKCFFFFLFLFIHKSIYYININARVLALHFKHILMYTQHII